LKSITTNKSGVRQEQFYIRDGNMSRRIGSLLLPRFQDKNGEELFSSFQVAPMVEQIRDFPKRRGLERK